MNNCAYNTQQSHQIIAVVTRNK